MLVAVVGFAQFRRGDMRHEQPKDVFRDYFSNRTLRVDYHRVGCAKGDTVKLVRYAEKECQWSGSMKMLIDPFDNGDYRVQVCDIRTHEVLYSRTYNSLFREYCGTEDGKTKSVCYEEVVQLPMPRVDVEICFQERNENQKFKTTNTFHFKPKGPVRRLFGSPEPRKLLMNGDVHRKIDVVIVAQGYGEDEEKLEKDFKHFTDILLSEEPFAGRKGDFNVWGVKGEAGAKYGTLGADRYLMTDSLFQLHNLLGKVPFDHIIIMVNNDKYGGGGIYNFYAVSSTNQMCDMVTPHELGHSIGGLADEYVDEDLSYTEMHKGKFEPKEPNITSLVDFGSKWKDMLPEGTKIPTEPVKGLGKRDNGPLGVYEGAGYQPKGLYRPVTNCMMNYYAHFCPVCSKRLNEVFDLYTK